MNFCELNKEKLKELKLMLEQEYSAYKNKRLSLDLSRGKPDAFQLDLSQPMLDTPLCRERIVCSDGMDCRNYGIVDGLPEMKKIFSELLGIPESYILIGGNSSLQLMFDALMRALVFGVKDSPRPWGQEEKRKWICVTPGYDRHFLITEKLGFELLSVKMTETGPDMDEVERLVKDPAVKGIWCVPKYSNPTGNTYSAKTVQRLAKMECAAPDFRIMWDNAYAVHDLSGEGDSLADIFAYAREYGHEDRVFYFSSTSKITFPGGGVAFIAASEANLEQIRPIVSTQTIGYDKLNQLRHIAFLKNAENTRAHMMKLGKMMNEKFRIALDALSELRGLGIAEWTEPRGGYFISLDVMPGCAKRVYELMSDAGVVLTKVGATYPYGIDPENKNLRIAPSYPSVKELTLSMKILVLTVKLAAVEKLLCQ